MSTNRRRKTATAVREQIEKKGIDAINSDEEQNGILDELQQEAFMSQMELLVRDYINRWRTMFGWLGLIVMYIHVCGFLGVFPLTSGLVGRIQPRSVILQFVLAPLNSLSLFASHQMSVIFTSLLSSFNVLVDFAIVTACLRHGVTYPDNPFRLRNLSHFATPLIFIAWVLLAIFSPAASLWGPHTVAIVATPLLAVFGELFDSSRTAALEGLEKLHKFKYSHRKA